jgi:tetratricopeptide (TPR) repeat protein
MKAMNKTTIFCGLFLLALIVCPIVTAAYDSRAEPYFNDGVSLVNAGRYSEAISAFDQALAIDPTISEAWYNHGTSLNKLGRFAEALNSFDRAVALNPNDALAWNNRGTALINLGRYSEAISSYDRAIALNPNDAVARSNRQLALEKQSQAESTPLTYAPIGAIILMAGIAVWSRRRSI